MSVSVVLLNWKRSKNLLNYILPYLEKNDLIDEIIASKIERSADGSVIFNPPTAFTYTSWSKQLISQCLCNTANNIGKR